MQRETRLAATEGSEQPAIQRPSPIKDLFRSRTGRVVLGLLALAALFLVAQHSAHVFGALPYVLLLACPLLHPFLHGGHDAGHGGGGPGPIGQGSGQTHRH